MKTLVVAVCSMWLCTSVQAAEDCSVADIVIHGWIRLARSHTPARPATEAVRKELAFETADRVVLNGYSYSPPGREAEAAAEPFVLLLQGSATAAAQLAVTASRLALAAGRDVFVYEYRGYAAGDTVVPTAAAIQKDVDAIIDLLSQGGRRGVVIGLSMGGFFAIRSVQHSTRRDLRALLDSTPAQAPAMPFLLNCPRWRHPLDAATADLAPRLGVVYAEADGWAKGAAAKELMERVRAGGGRAWSIAGGHVDLSPAGLARRLPIYVEFVRAGPP